MKKIIIVTTFAVLLVCSWIAFQLYRSHTTGANIPSRMVENMNISLTDADILSQGNFIKIDALHWGSGDVQVLGKGENVYIVFGENFQVANGPDLYVYLSGEQNYGGAKMASIENTINLGPIIKKEGKQIYKVSQAEWQLYHHSLLIWCRAFGVHFSHALLGTPQ